MAYPGVAPAMAGLTMGSFVIGIGAILASTAVLCFGLGIRSATGLLVGGAFAILGVLLAAAAIVTGVQGVRQVRRAGGERTGRGLALAGIWCGGAGALLTIVGMGSAALLLYG